MDLWKRLSSFLRWSLCKWIKEDIFAHFVNRLKSRRRVMLELFLKIHGWWSTFKPSFRTTRAFPNNKTKVVNYVLSSRVQREELKHAKEKKGCLGGLSSVACKMVCEDKTLERAMRAQRVAKCLHISASYLHCPVGDNQHSAPSQQDYRENPEIKKSLNGSPLTGTCLPKKSLKTSWDIFKVPS